MKIFLASLEDRRRTAIDRDAYEKAPVNPSRICPPKAINSGMPQKLPQGCADSVRDLHVFVDMVKDAHKTRNASM